MIISLSISMGDQETYAREEFERLWAVMSLAMYGDPPTIEEIIDYDNLVIEPIDLEKWFRTLKQGGILEEIGGDYSTWKIKEGVHLNVYFKKP